MLELICSLLHPHEPTQRPLMACLADLGGVQLFMSLVQREQQSIRVLGLRILASFVPLAPPAMPPLNPGSTGELHSRKPTSPATLLFSLPSFLVTSPHNFIHILGKLHPRKKGYEWRYYP